MECLQWKTWTAEEVVNQKLRKKRQRKRREDGGSTGRAGLPPTMAGGEMSGKGALNILSKFSFKCQTFSSAVSFNHGPFSLQLFTAMFVGFWATSAYFDHFLLTGVFCIAYGVVAEVSYLKFKV